MGWGFCVLSLLSLLCPLILGNYSGITYFPELSDLGLLPAGVVFSAICSFESRMALSNLITCLSCNHMKNGVSATKAKKNKTNK